LIEERCNFLINDELKFKIEFKLFSINTLYDPFDILKVEILDEDKITVLQTIVSPNIIKTDVGKFYVVGSYDWNNKTRNVFDKWYYVPTTGALERIETQTAYIDDITAIKEDHRKGFAYNNPDMSGNNGWGSIITPDELRSLALFGNPLVAPTTGENIPDSVLQWYIDNETAILEKDLKYKIIPQYVYTRGLVGTTEREDLDMNVLATQNYIWDEAYDFRYQDFKKFMRIKLNYFPTAKILKLVFRDPLAQTLFDFTKWTRVNTFSDGSVEIFPNTIDLAFVPFFSANPSLFGSLRGDYFPDAWLVDYLIGFETINEFMRKHRELVGILQMMCTLPLLQDYGDGKSAALASSSISLSGISESFSTTQSATNALFGARILSYGKQLKDWYKKNQYSYGLGRNLVGGA